MESAELLLLATLLNYKKGLMDMMITMNNAAEDDEVEELDVLIRFKKQFKPPRITAYISEVVNFYDDLQFQQNFRLKKSAFEILLQIVTPILIKADAVAGRPQIDPKYQLLAVIWLLATPDSYQTYLQTYYKHIWYCYPLLYK